MKLTRASRVHIVGIGGSGTYYLALFLHYLGWPVSGSDCAPNQRVENLKKLGIKIFIGHQESNLKVKPELVIVSPAIIKELPELRAAKKAKIKIIGYSHFLDLVFRWLRKDRDQKLIKLALAKSNFAPFYQLDFKQLNIIGITGTDGKTTTTSMIYHLGQNCGLKTGMITTVKAKLGSKEIDTGLHTTTPPAQQLAPIIQEMVDGGAEWLALEITSHGLAQHRVEGLKLKAAIYTNITREHLDFHQTWLAYLQAKARMIEMVDPNGIVVLNRDDRSFELLKEMVKRRHLPYLTYGRQKGADLLIQRVETGPWQTKAWLKFGRKTHLLTLPLIGEYNVSNAAAAILASQQMGIKIEEAIESLKSFSGVAGRMNVIQKKPFTIIVDFAHTPNGLAQALKSVRKLAQKDQKLIVVFGCAGQRDKNKRPKMGQIAAELADIVVLVPEDPRQEKTAQINQEIIRGIQKPKTVFSSKKSISRDRVEKELKQGKKVIISFDSDRPQARRKGLAWAIKNARPGDIIIACGKGHEKSLCFNNQEYPWDEIKIIKRLIKN